MKDHIKNITGHHVKRIGQSVAALLMGAVLGVSALAQGGGAHEAAPETIYDRGLDPSGGVQRAPFRPDPGLLCELPVVWESESVNMPFPRTPMVVGEEAVFTGSEKITALNRQTGEIIWQFTMPDIDYNIALYNSGVGAMSIDADTVYYGGYAGMLYAFDRRSGEVRWRYVLEGKPGIREQIAVDGQHVYFSSMRWLRALDKRTGEEVWVFEARSMSAPLVRDGRVYVVSGQGVYALDSRNGQQVWESQVEGTRSGFDTLYSVPYMGGQKLVTAGTGDGVFYAFDTATGEQLWMLNHRYIGNRWRASWSAGDDVLLSDLHGAIALFDTKAQRMRWWFHMGGESSYMPPAVYQGLVLKGTDGRYLFAIDLQTGEEVFRYHTREHTDALRALEVKDGILYAASANGRIYALRLECPQLEGRPGF